MAPPRKFDRTMAIKMFADGSAKRAIARALEVDMGSILHALRQENIGSPQDAERWLSLRGMTPPPQILAAPVSLDRPISEVIASRLADSDRVEARLNGGEWYSVLIPDSLPVGIIHLGDPHLDNPGTLFRWFHDDVETVLRTPGMYVSQVGDTLDNWVGRLMSLHAMSNVTAAEGWRMVEHYAERLGPRLLLWILGNHCKWNSGSEILARILRGAPCVVAEDEARVLFVMADGSEFSLAMRHEWPGGSIYHATHGVAKPLKFGLEVDMAIGGHKHSGGYIVMPSPHTGRLRHGIQLSTYKYFDSYGKAKGFDAPMASPSVMTILDPQGGPIDRVSVYFRDPVRGFEKGLSALAALREARRKASAALRSGSSKPAG